VQFKHVFAGEGVRRRKIQAQAGVNRLAARVGENMQAGAARLRQAAQQARCQRGNLRAGNTYDADTAAARRGGNGGDGIGVGMDIDPSSSRHARLQPVCGRGRCHLPAASTRLVMTYCWAIDSVLLTTQ
jgi:hypothetical protein